MSTVIEDGTGRGYRTKVNTENRMQVVAVTEPAADHACELGRRYNLNTGSITLDNATETTVLYVKNNETQDLIITALIYNMGATTGGSGNSYINWIENPTDGDIITNGNVVAANSGQNYGLVLALDVDAYKGASGETAQTTGSLSGASISPSGTGRLLVALGALVLPQGKSIAIDYTPPSGNSSQVCNFAIACYLKTTEN